jgi:hypothetical protein
MTVCHIVNRLLAKRCVLIYKQDFCDISGESAFRPRSTRHIERGLQGLLRGKDACFVVTFVVTALLWVISIQAKGSFDDIQFPRPKSIPVWNQQANWRIEKDVVRVTAILDVDEKGLVKNATSVDSAHNNLFSHVHGFLKTLVFTPFTVDGRKSGGVVPVRVLFRPGLGYVDLELPLDSTGAIVDRILYDSMVALNGYSPPRLAKFPPYHCGLSYKDKVTSPPFVLFKVASDTLGNINDAKLIKSTMPLLTSQLQSAVRWSKLTPPKKEGKSLRSNPYLAIFFFPGINYPTRPFVADSIPTVLSKLEISQLRLIPDSSRYLFLPIPKNTPYDSLYLHKEKATGGLENLTAFIQIDSTGQSAIYFPPRLSVQARNEIGDISTSLKFYPALDFAGRPVMFYGTIRLEFTDSTLVRIWYEWLNSTN